MSGRTLTIVVVALVLVFVVVCCLVVGLVGLAVLANFSYGAAPI